jgi:predicted  nucleic acid-binding Zn-ribbon protein
MKQNLSENKDDPTHAEYIKHIETLMLSNYEMKEVIRRQTEELENLRNNFHFFINGYKKMAIKLKFVSERVSKIKDDIKNPASFLNDDSSMS